MIAGTEAKQGSPWPRSYSLAGIGRGGLQDRIEAGADERQAMAALLDLEALAYAAFEFVLTPLARGRVRVRGRVRASATQCCVVTLEPVDAAIDEAVDTEFWPAEQLAPRAGNREVEVALDGAEPIAGDALDLGQLAYEAIAAALDPYPRVPDARFDWPADPETPAQKDGPFAALKYFKRG